MSAPVLDAVGNEIKPGDTIVYPVRKGSSMWLSRTTVSQVEEGKITGHNNLGRLVHVRNLENVAVVVPPEKQRANV